MRLKINNLTNYRIVAGMMISFLLLAGCAGKPTTAPLSATPQPAVVTISRPDEPVTRTEAAMAILLGIHGNAYLPPPATGQLFTDVSADRFGAAWIEDFALAGISSGCGDGKFCPDNPVTRAQVAVLLLRGKYGAAYTPPVGKGIFTDIESGKGDWAEQLVSEGIAAECGTALYCPADQVTRAQMAEFLAKTFVFH